MELYFSEDILKKYDDIFKNLIDSKKESEQYFRKLSKKTIQHLNKVNDEAQSTSGQTPKKQPIIKKTGPKWYKWLFGGFGTLCMIGFMIGLYKYRHKFIQ